MREGTLDEIRDDVATARSALSDALHLAQIAAMQGNELDGWLPALQDCYAAVYALEVQMQEQPGAAA